MRQPGKVPTFTTIHRGLHMKRVRLRTLLLWVAFVLLVQGCAIGQILDVATEDQLRQVEKSRIFSNSYDAVWAATTKSLVTHGVSIQSQDKSSGNISTDWILEKEAIGVFTTGSRFKVTILLEKKTSTSTQVTVIPTFEIRVAEEANWEPTSRKKSHLDVEKRLFDDIQNNLL